MAWRGDLSLGIHITAALSFMPNHVRSAVNNSETPFPSSGRDEEDTEFSRRLVSRALMELHIYSSDINVMHMGPHSEDAPKRYLQHSSRTELFWEYTAYCQANDQEPGSFATFLRVANKVLRPGMRGSALALQKGQ